jgi:hypothetical protein
MQSARLMPVRQPHPAPLESTDELPVTERAKRDADIGEHAACSCCRADASAHVALLNTLDPVVSAGWNADTMVQGLVSASSREVSKCTPGTRVSVLQDIMAWATDSDSSCVFWLNGLAGTGKSTIARTLCEYLHERKLLGASFFISRDQPDRRNPSNIVRTIAHQLALGQELVADSLCTKLREKPISATRSLRDQITDFIVIPSRELHGTTSFIIIIDALDECIVDDAGRPGGELLLLLVRQLMQLGGRLRLLLTSRGEIPIQDMFRELSTVAPTVIKLQDLDTVVVRTDITTYLTHSFTQIRVEQLKLAADSWPSAESLEKLVELSGLLFIYAATAVRFVRNRNFDPRLRLTQLLGQERQSAGVSPYQQLDALYRQILNDAVKDPDGDEEILCLRLQAVMAVIVLAQTPLSMEALGTVSGVSSWDIQIVVGQLSSLLVDNESRIRVFHPSFPNFAVNPVRCTNPLLRVAPLADHGTIALRCLSLLNQHLRYNVCNLEDHTIANDEVQGLDLLLCENVSDALRYAVCFWCIHLSASDSTNGFLLDALDEFCRKHPFHWVEVLSLVKSVPSAETAVLQVIQWCEVFQFDH